ncbi:MAG TPA: hypothetical protein VJQ59_16805 [Candidatus Sulfotelmatobacter sp.]|nr:hypothetical protein [Candidatus Sulfotelmatobacter sp.]
MQTDQMNVTADAFNGVLAMLAAYGRAVSGAQAGLEENSDEWTTAGTEAAVHFCDDGDEGTTEVLGADGLRRVMVMIVPVDDNRSDGDSSSIGAQRGSFSEIESACATLRQQPARVLEQPPLQANLTSADGQYQFQFVFVAPGASE